MAKPFKLADLHTVVPAATPAWIRLIDTYGAADDGQPDAKEWQDIVLPVLAYAALPGGIGAFLVCTGSDGPAWCTHRRTEGGRTAIELSVGTKPQRGTPCPFTDGYEYDDESLSDGILYCADWITA